MSGPNPEPYPPPHEIECWQTGCPAPGPWKDVPALAAHRFAAHGIEVPETYAETGYRDQDAPVVTAACGFRCAPRDLEKHHAKCRTCRTATTAAPPSAPNEEAGMKVTAPCGKRVEGGSALGGHKGKCKACRGIATQEAGTPAASSRLAANRAVALAKKRASASRATPALVIGDGSTVAILLAQAEAFEAKARVLREAAEVIG